LPTGGDQTCALRQGEIDRGSGGGPAARWQSVLGATGAFLPPEGQLGGRVAGQETAQRTGPVLGEHYSMWRSTEVSMIF